MALLNCSSTDQIKYFVPSITFGGDNIYLTSPRLNVIQVSPVKTYGAIQKVRNAEGGRGSVKTLLRRYAVEVGFDETLRNQAIVVTI